MFHVGTVQPVPVKIYDYYKPGASIFHNIESLNKRRFQWSHRRQSEVSYFPFDLYSNHRINIVKYLFTSNDY